MEVLAQRAAESEGERGGGCARLCATADFGEAWAAGSGDGFWQATKNEKTNIRSTHVVGNKKQREDQLVGQNLSPDNILL